MNSKINPNRIFIYLSIIEKDSRITVWHLALLIAIFRLGHRQDQHHIIRVSRSNLMALSHINTLPTYYKYFKELQAFGYIKYTPSYDPRYRSEIELLLT